MTAKKGKKDKNVQRQACKQCRQRRLEMNLLSHSPELHECVKLKLNGCHLHLFDFSPLCVSNVEELFFTVDYPELHECVKPKLDRCHFLKPLKNCTPAFFLAVQVKAKIQKMELLVEVKSEGINLKLRLVLRVRKEHTILGLPAPMMHL